MTNIVYIHPLVILQFAIFKHDPYIYISMNHDDVPFRSDASSQMVNRSSFAYGFMMIHDLPNGIWLINYTILNHYNYLHVCS